MPSRPMPPDESEPKITVLFSAEERVAAENLARYWDATVSGRPSDDARTLDPELALVVRLLRHYHDVTRGHPGAAATRSDAATRRQSSPARNASTHPVMRAAIASVGLVLLLFTISAVTSPRSWLLSPAADPDWIPWVSDDWLGPDAVTSRSVGGGLVLPLSQTEGGVDGA